MGRRGLTVRVAGLSRLPPSARRPRLFEAAVRRAFARTQAQGEVSVVFQTRQQMRRLNLEFLGHDWDTDVLAFRHEMIAAAPTTEQGFGDIYVSGFLARIQAAGQGHSVLREALILAAHGALHLLGHDDAAPRAQARMFRLQDEILAGLGKAAR
ncbi:MAG: rRNA maturation RNase YbeY [Elusimicrobia bacterium]|nr:rRNA maturation RNase YbeY [Elusimicrobiota bacterium]